MTADSRSPSRHTDDGYDETKKPDCVSNSWSLILAVGFSLEIVNEYCDSVSKLAPVARIDLAILLQPNECCSLVYDLLH